MRKKILVITICIMACGFVGCGSNSNDITDTTDNVAVEDTQEVATVTYPEEALVIPNECGYDYKEFAPEGFEPYQDEDGNWILFPEDGGEVKIDIAAEGKDPFYKTFDVDKFGRTKRYIEAHKYDDELNSTTEDVVEYATINEDEITCVRYSTMKDGSFENCDWKSFDSNGIATYLSVEDGQIYTKEANVLKEDLAGKLSSIPFSNEKNAIACIDVDFSGTTYRFYVNEGETPSPELQAIIDVFDNFNFKE